MNKNSRTDHDAPRHREQGWEPFFIMLFEVEDMIEARRQKDLQEIRGRKSPGDPF